MSRVGDGAGLVDCLPQPSKLQQEVNYFHEGFSVEVEVGVRKFETNSAGRTSTTSSLQQQQQQQAANNNHLLILLHVDQQ